jgi:hypothetical protein
MRLHLPSFVIGLALGAGGAVLAPKFKPLFVELATGCYRVIDAALVRVARGRESVADLLAEARVRARSALRPAEAAA